MTTGLRSAKVLPIGSELEVLLIESHTAAKEGAAAITSTKQTTANC